MREFPNDSKLERQKNKFKNVGKIGFFFKKTQCSV